MAPKGSRDWQAVQTALADVRRAHAKQPLQEPWRLALLEAEVALAQADSEGRHADGVREAAAIYRNLKLDEKAQKTVLPLIAMAFDRLDLREDAERTIAQWEKIVAARQARMLCARLAASHKKYDEARRLAQTDLDKLGPAERSDALRFLVQLSLLQRDWQMARTELDCLAKTGFSPRDLDLLFAYAELAAEQKQPAEVERCRRKFIEIEGDDGRYAQYLRASDILAQVRPSGSTQLGEARDLIDRLNHQYPEWPAGMLLRARLLEIEGHGEEAASAYREAIRCGAAGVGPYERLIDLLSRAGRTAEAESWLDRLREQSFVPEGADALEAQLLARRGERDKALEVIRRVAQQHPKNAAIQLSLGQMLLASGQSTEAVAALQRAVDIAPDSLPAIRALAVCFIEIKQPDEARRVLAKLAVRKDLPEIDKQLLMAEVDELLGDAAAARDHYQAACDVPPPDVAVRLRMAAFLLRSPRKEDAAVGEKLVRAIVLDSPNYAPARRFLAGMLAQRGGEGP